MIFSFNYVHCGESCLTAVCGGQTWSRCTGLLSSDLVKLSQRPFGTTKWQGQFIQTALSGPHLLGDQPVPSGEAQHLPTWNAVWLPLWTLWHQWLEMGMNTVSDCPNVSWSCQNVSWSFPSAYQQSQKKKTSLCPLTRSRTAGKCIQSPCRSSLNTSSFLWKERTAVISSHIELSL